MVSMCCRCSFILPNINRCKRFPFQGSNCRIPVFREYLLGLGVGCVSRASIVGNLARQPGASVMTLGQKCFWCPSWRQFSPFTAETKGGKFWGPLLWMNEILHHPRNPGRIPFPCITNHGFNHGSKWCDFWISSTHSSELQAFLIWLGISGSAPEN